MKKTTLVRSDKPHAVKMAEGTNVAQRKSAKKTSGPEAPSAPPDNIQKIAPEPVAATEPAVVTAVVPAMLLKPVRAKTKLTPARTPSTPSAPSAPNSVSPTAKTKAAAKPKPPLKSAAPAKPKAATKPAAKARPSAAPKLAPKPAPQPAPKPAPPPEPVWEQDNPIKKRIEQLKTRNAQLAEQLQRLQSSTTARGKRP